MVQLLIARHGNTFEPGEILRRIGCKTDLPLSESGRQQARHLGKFLQNHYSQLSAVYSSCLKRCVETAQIALEAGKFPEAVKPLSIFDEIDYGIDEGKSEDQVVSRIGQAAIKRWDTEALVPPGWLVDPDQIIANWKLFASKLQKQGESAVVLVVTSNGIARFAPDLLTDRVVFKQNYPIKIATGAICCLYYKQGWQLDYWNVKPQDNPCLS